MFFSIKNGFFKQKQIKSEVGICCIVLLSNSLLIDISPLPTKNWCIHFSCDAEFFSEGAISNFSSISKPLNKLWMLSLPSHKLSEFKLRSFLSTAISSLCESFSIFIYRFLKHSLRFFFKGNCFCNAAAPSNL